MIGAAHTSTLADLEAARRDLRAAEGHGRFDWTETPVLAIESVFADATETLPEWRERLELDAVDG